MDMERVSAAGLLRDKPAALLQSRLRDFSGLWGNVISLRRLGAGTASGRATITNSTSTIDSLAGMAGRIWHSPVFQVSLLRAGIAGAVVYAAGDALSGALYDGYSFRDQAVSELSAYGSPVRPLAVSFISVQGLLELGFNLGVWEAGKRYRALRWTAGCLLASGILTAPLHPFFPMSSRGMVSGPNDTAHQVITMAFVPLVIGAVVSSAFALPGRFRLYAIGSLVVMAASAAMTGPLMENLATNKPTPGLGAFERVNAYTMFFWIIVLALVLMRRVRAEGRAGT